MPTLYTNGLFAAISLDFPDDPKVIEAGPMAELAYIRCTIASKRLLTDGVIHRAQARRWLDGIPGDPAEHLNALVAVGLLEPHESGWCIPIDVWAKWNKLAADVQVTRNKQSEGGKKGNHERHHVKAGKYDPECPMCVASSVGDRLVIGDRSVDRLGGDRPKTETKPESKTTPQPADAAAESDRKRRVVEEYVRIGMNMAAASGTPVRHPSGYAMKLGGSARAHPDFDRWLEMFPTAPPDAVAAWLHGDKGSMRYYERADELATVTELRGSA